MKLPVGFPKFQTVEWWIEELGQYSKDKIVAVATGPLEPAKAMASIYPDCDEDIIWIDVE